MTLESYLKRVCSILANAEKRKNEAVERENKAHEDNQKAAEEAYNLHLRMDEKEGVQLLLDSDWWQVYGMHFK